MLDRKQVLRILGIALFLGLIFWLLDSLMLFFYYSRNLRQLIFTPPETLLDAIWLNLSPQMLFTRISFVLMCLAGGLIVLRYLSQQREVQQHYQTYVDTAPLGVFVIDKNGRFVDVNPAACKLLGYSADEILRHPLIAIFEPKDKQLIRTYIEALQRDKSMAIHTRPHRKDGTVFDLQVDAVMLPNGSIMGFGQDISARLTAEQERSAAVEALEKSQAQYEMIVEHVDDIVWQMGADAHLTYVSPAVTRMLGYSVAEVLSPDGANPFSLAHKNGVSNPAAGHPHGDASPPPQSMEITMRHRDGHPVNVEIISTAVLNPEGELLGYVGIARDITRRKQAEQQIRDYAEHLEEMVRERTQQLEDAQERLLRQERLAALGQIAGGISHELRNPLGVIMNAVYYLRLVETEPSDTLREYLDLINLQVNKASKIITDLLDFARSTSINREPVAVAELMTELVSRYPPPKKVDVQLNVPVDLPQAYIDPHQIGQVFENLITNAYQAMPEGGILSLDAEVVQDKLVVKVADTGSGINPENISRIFEPLFTTKAKGIGLGLAISKKLVEANDGAIHVESSPGAGTVFKVYLPVYA